MSYYSYYTRLTYTAAIIAEKDRFNNNTNYAFPSLIRLLSSKYKPESADTRPDVEGTAGQGNDQAPDYSLLGPCRSRASSTHCKRAEFFK